MKYKQKQTENNHKKLHNQNNKNNFLEKSGKKIVMKIVVDKLDQTDPLTFTFAPT